MGIIKNQVLLARDALRAFRECDNGDGDWNRGDGYEPEAQDLRDLLFALRLYAEQGFELRGLNWNSEIRELEETYERIKNALAKG